jgi:hypothetical protein
MKNEKKEEIRKRSGETDRRVAVKAVINVPVP